MPDEIDLEQPPEDAPEAPELDNPESTPAAGTQEGAAPAKPAPTPQPQPIVASFSREQIGDLAASISAGIVNGFKPAEPTPAASLPTGPTGSEIDAKIQEIDDQIDTAQQEGKGIAALLRARDALRDQKFENERVAPLRVQGANSINTLTIDAIERTDPYLTKYKKEVMALLGPAIQQGQVLNLEIVSNALKFVKANHLDEIFEDRQQETARKAKLATAAPMPGATNGRVRAAAPRTPATIKERFGVPADEAFKHKRAKYDEDTFARRLGFKDKADWFARDDEMSSPDFNIGLDSVWDARNNRWVLPNELNKFYGG